MRTITGSTVTYLDTGGQVSVEFSASNGEVTIEAVANEDGGFEPTEQERLELEAHVSMCMADDYEDGKADEADRKRDR